MKILMTGSHGFVGTNLIGALSGEHEIIRWDVRSDDELTDSDAVIHLAGKAHDVKVSDVGGLKAEEYFYVNAELTKKIYDAFLKSSAKKFIFFSSIKAKDNDTPYAKSKKAAEDYILNEISRQVRDDKGRARDDNEIPHQMRDEGNASTGSATVLEDGEKKVYILRPCMIHGKGVKGNLPLLFKFVKKGWPWPLAAFENKRSYTSMGNVSYVVSELLKKDVDTGIYNICDDEPVSTNDLIRLMSEFLGRQAKMLRVPKGLIVLGAKIGTIMHLPLNTERLNKLTRDYIVDNRKIKNALEIDQMPVMSTEGLEVTIREMIEK